MFEDDARDFVADYMSHLPVLRDLAICREASTHDRRGGNDNGFSNKAEWVRRESGLGVVSMEAAGPGMVTSMWYSWPNHPLLPGWLDRGWGRRLGRIGFYFGAEEQPRLGPMLCELVGAKPFVYPLAIPAKDSTGGYNVYAPIPFSDGLRVSVDGGRLPMFFTHFWYHSYPRGTRVKSWTEADDYSEMARLWDPSVVDEPAAEGAHEVEGLSVEAGRSCELMDLEGPGVIACVRIQAPEDDAALRSTWLRAWWDDQPEPAIDAPLSLLLAIESRFLQEPAAIAKNAELKSLVVGRDREGFFYLRLPAPFAKRARLVLENRGEAAVSIARVRVECHERALAGLGDTAGYLRTQFRESPELTPGRDYVLAELSGRGQIVGTVLAVADTAETFLEGDERCYTDGCRSPSVMGDATETYFNGSWYFCEQGFACPLHGAPTFRMDRKMVGSNSTITMYRFHLADFIPFRDGARFSIQHGGFNDVPGHYRSLVFYYGLDQPSLARTDYVTLADDADLEAHEYSGATARRVEERAGFFEGDLNGQDLGIKGRPDWFPAIHWNTYLTVRGIFHDPPDDSPAREKFTVCEHEGAYEFTARIDPDNRAVMLRRLFDQSVPDQRARIEVDGLTAGEWRNPGRNQWKIWCEDDLILDPARTRGKSEVRVRVVPLSAAFTAVEYTVYSIS